MKKIFTFICAALVAFSANAAQIAQEVEFVQAPAAQKIQKAQLTQAPTLTVNNQKGKMAPMANKRLTANHQAVPAKPTARKAANAVAEDFNVTATSVYFSNYYGYYDYYMYVDGGAYDFSGIEPIEGKTYTLADMDADYTGWYSNEDGGYLTTKATAATLTVSKKNGLPYVVGTMTLGGNNYTITYELKLTDTVTVNATNLAVKSHFYGGYEYTFNDANWTFDIVDFDMAAKTGTLQNIDFDYSCVYPTGGSSWDAYNFVAVVEDVVVAQDADTLKLTGAIAAENGILYVLDARYEKPAAKEITLVADTLDFNTKLTAGFYTVSGYNVDSKYSFQLYFISKSITGNFTEEDMDAYQTWVDEKDGKKTLVSYQNLSAANIQVTLVKDTVYYVGTMTLATNDGQEAIFTLNLSSPYKQEWGEWADFAPFDFNTGKFNYATLGGYTQVGIQVLERKDNTGLKQYKLKNWGKGYFDGVGQDLILNMNPDYTFTFVSSPVNVGAEVILADVATAFGDPSYASYNSYNPETGVFSFYTAVVFASSGQIYGTAEESLVMDRPILERDTVNIVSTKLQYNNLIASNGVVIYYAADVPNYYVFRVTSNTTTVDGTFKWADGTINENNSYFTVEGVKNYFQDGEFTVVTEGKNIALNGWMIGTDEKYYRLDMSYTAPTERDTVDIISTKMVYHDFLASNQAVQFYAGSDVEGYTTFLVTSKNASTIDGTFDIYVGYSFADSIDGSQIGFEEGQITVVKEDDVYHLTGWVIGDNEKYYRLDWTEITGVLDYDTDAPFEANFTADETGVEFEDGVIKISATNAENLTMGLVLFTDLAATEIPSGTYVISDSEEAGTALKSIGIYGGWLTECWAGVKTSSGIADCWFVVDGSVVLSYNEDHSALNIVLDGTNSWGQSVKATAVASMVPTSFEKVNAEQTINKVLRNGQVLIQKNNKTYTVLGQEVK